jgi:hypothetical protein
MHFGLANTPEAFRSYINVMPWSYLVVFVIAYLDNTVVHSSTMEEHRRHVCTVLEVLLKADQYLKLSKCVYNAKEIGSVRFIITLKKVRMEKDRIATIKWWPMPDSHRDIQVFLGFINFYRHFLKSFLRIVQPMTAVRTVRIGYRETLRIVLASPLEIRQCRVQRLLCLISRGGESRGQVAKAARPSCRA